MIIGFTGTQEGMSAVQLQTLQTLILRNAITIASELHHGDCVGADAQAHYIAQNLNMSIVVHPPTNDRKRAHCSGEKTEVLRPFPYLMRNKHIVNASEWLIAAPKEFDEQLRSGTWSTIRYAVNKGRDVSIILPDGVIRCR
jgi:hypothetical protein